jgi:hypothetical protein
MNEQSVLSRSSFAIAIVAALTLGACSSSSKISGGGGGSGGATGGSGGAAGGSAAGAPGDAAAGAPGAAGSDGGTTEAAAEAPPAPELNSCGDPAKLGAATVLAQTGVLGGDRATPNLSDAIDWLGMVNSATEPQTLEIQLYKSTAPFGAMLAPMSISLTGQSDFATCGACVFFHPGYRDNTPLKNQPNYVATSGTLNLTAVPSASGSGMLTGTLSNVTFEHIMIDPDYKTTKVDDCTITLTSASINVTLP